MTLAQAIALIRPAVDQHGGTWADLGAGNGLFTRALASLLGAGGRIYALDRDVAAVTELANLARDRAADGADIVPVRGDIRQLDAVAELVGVELDGAIVANALHFVREPVTVLRAIANRLAGNGRIVVVEYAGRRANRWVPYPVPVDRLASAAAGLPLDPPAVVAERASLYGGTIYTAVLRAEPARAR